MLLSMILIISNILQKMPENLVTYAGYATTKARPESSIHPTPIIVTIVDLVNVTYQCQIRLIFNC